MADSDFERLAPDTVAANETRPEPIQILDHHGSTLHEGYHQAEFALKSKRLVQVF